MLKPKPWRPLSEDMITIGERLKRIAYGRGWTLKTLAAELKCAPPYLSNLFRGKRPVSAVFLGRYCLIVDCIHLLPQLMRHAEKDGIFVTGRRKKHHYES